MAGNEEDAGDADAGDADAGEAAAEDRNEGNDAAEEEPNVGYVPGHMSQLSAELQAHLREEPLTIAMLSQQSVQRARRHNAPQQDSDVPSSSSSSDSHHRDIHADDPSMDQEGCERNVAMSTEDMSDRNSRSRSRGSRSRNRPDQRTQPQRVAGKRGGQKASRRERQALVQRERMLLMQDAVKRFKNPSGKPLDDQSRSLMLRAVAHRMLVDEKVSETGAVKAVSKLAHVSMGTLRKWMRHWHDHGELLASKDENYRTRGTASRKRADRDRDRDRDRSGNNGLNEVSSIAQMAFAHPDADSHADAAHIQHQHHYHHSQQQRNNNNTSRSNMVQGSALNPHKRHAGSEPPRYTTFLDVVQAHDDHLHNPASLAGLYNRPEPVVSIDTDTRPPAESNASHGLAVSPNVAVPGPVTTHVHQDSPERAADHHPPTSVAAVQPQPREASRHNYSSQFPQDERLLQSSGHLSQEWGNPISLANIFGAPQDEQLAGRDEGTTNTHSTNTPS